MSQTSLVSRLFVTLTENNPVAWWDSHELALNLSISETVWDHIESEKNRRQPTSKEELLSVFQEAWRVIPEDYSSV